MQQARSLAKELDTTFEEWSCQPQSTPDGFSPILLRDLCECSACLDPSTKQKLFSTADIPSKVAIDSVVHESDGIRVKWLNDLPGYDGSHETLLKDDLLEQIRDYADASRIEFRGELPFRKPWKADAYCELADFNYEAYMQDDNVLLQALQQLHTHGLMLLRDVPESEKSVSTIGERIGPLKNTFYGYTWDVRSVPEAKNVAYTSQDLGFHMDLLYMKQPPHIQLLHCIRSSSSGGASLFTDSFQAAQEMYHGDFEKFCTLSNSEVNFHYHHPSSHLYQQSWPVFELTPRKHMSTGDPVNDEELGYVKASHGTSRLASSPEKSFKILDHLSAVNWSPPFQAPFGNRSNYTDQCGLGHVSVGREVERWHSAAKEFSQLIHRPEAIYDRLMKPGECVIFDNRRVLHARRAFNAGDAGKERWLRGAYLDKDPFLSKMRVLNAVQK